MPKTTKNTKPTYPRFFVMITESDIEDNNLDSATLYSKMTDAEEEATDMLNEEADFRDSDTIVIYELVPRAVFTLPEQPAVTRTSLTK